MKKLILLVLTAICSIAMSAATKNYYVSATGDNANDGLSAGAPLATLVAAQNRIVAEGTATDYIVNVTAGTITESVQMQFLVNRTVTVTIKGAGADKTFFQRYADGAYSTNKNSGRFFQLTDDKAKNVTLIVEDLTFKNFGFSNGDGGAIFNQKNNRIELRRCIVKNSTARSGAISQLFTANANFVVEDCYFTNITTLSYNSCYSAILAQQGHVTIKNCIIDNCLKDYKNLNGGNKTDNSGLFVTHQGAAAGGSLTLINNTFLNNDIKNPDGFSLAGKPQSLVAVNSTANTVAVTIANNLFVDNFRVNMTIGQSADINIYDVFLNGKATKTNCTNNVMRAQNGLGTTGNVISADYDFNSTDIAYIMQGSTPAQFVTTTGIPYYMATGTEIINKSLVSLQPTTDIVGNTRNTTACIGASEYQAPGVLTPQAITLSAVSTMDKDDANFNLNASVSSGLTLTYTSSNPAVASVTSDGEVDVLAVGSTTIEVSQAGDASYSPVSKSILLRVSDETITIYVDANGDDSNDGLSEAAPLASLSAAAAASVADGIATTYNVKVSGAITDLQTHAEFIYNRADNITVKVYGDDAATSSLQKCTDAEYATFLASPTVITNTAGRFFQNPENQGAGTLSLIIEDMSFRNFGFNDENGGALFNCHKATDVTMRRCNVTNGAARMGSIVQTSGGLCTITLEGCYFGDLTTIDNNSYGSPIYMNQKGALVVENCVFNNLNKAATQVGPNSSLASQYGSVITFTPSHADQTARIVNNTFINNNSDKTDHTVNQCAIYVQANVDGSGLTLANNLFVGNTSATTTEDYYDVLITKNSAKTVIPQTNCTNNVLTSQSGLGETGNDIDAGYSYASDGIAVVTDNNLPELFTTDKGVFYIKANGTNVFETGLATVAPTKDITGADRSTTVPSVGAYETDGQVPTQTSKTLSVAFNAYPNPTSGQLFFSEEVTDITIYSLTGKQVFEAHSSQSNIDVSSLCNGVYFVTCKDAQGSNLNSLKFIKE